MRKPDRAQPISILGAPRSGSKLLTGMVDARRRLGSGNGAHHFEELSDGFAQYL